MVGKLSSQRPCSATLIYLNEPEHATYHRVGTLDKASLPLDLGGELVYR